MERFPLYIAGQMVEAEGGDWFETKYPYTNETWAMVARGTAGDVDRAVRAAHGAFSDGDWPRLRPSQRGRLLLRLGDLIDENLEVLARAEMQDNGKTITEVRGQVRTLAPIYRYYAGLADKVQGSVIPGDDGQFLNYTVYDPLGVVAAITPWNSPLRLLALKLAPALAAGNTVVAKPSEFTSTSTLKFMRLVEEAGIPPGVVNVVTGFGSEVGQPLAEHPLVRKVSFTGGVDGGTRAYETAARGIKSVILELGGKSPNIVFEDADLAAAAEGAAAGVFGSTGQTCIAGSRLLVQETVHDDVVDRVVAIARSKKLGDPMDEGTEVAPVATEPQFEKIMTYIRLAEEEGAQLVTGGRRAQAPGLERGYFVEPTVFTKVRNEMRIAQEEVFGPVLCVIPFKDEVEAVSIANDVTFGLASGIWTRDLARAHRVARRLQAGTVWINSYRKNVPQVPVGGYKSSGLGREAGAEAIKEYLQTKSVWVNLQ